MSFHDYHHTLERRSWWSGEWISACGYGVPAKDATKGTGSRPLCPKCKRANKKGGK